MWGKRPCTVPSHLGASQMLAGLVKPLLDVGRVEKDALATSFQGKLGIISGLHSHPSRRSWKWRRGFVSELWLLSQSRGGSSKSRVRVDRGAHVTNSSAGPSVRASPFQARHSDIVDWLSMLLTVHFPISRLQLHPHQAPSKIRDGPPQDIPAFCFIRLLLVIGA